VNVTIEASRSACISQVADDVESKCERRAAPALPFLYAATGPKWEKETDQMAPNKERESPFRRKNEDWPLLLMISPL
jgi:hypothetical protein